MPFALTDCRALTHHGPHPDVFALHLGECSKNAYDAFANRGTGVKILGQADESAVVRGKNILEQNHHVFL
jgi:hypothetical protein